MALGPARDAVTPQTDPGFERRLTLSPSCNVTISLVKDSNFFKTTPLLLGELWLERSSNVPNELRLLLAYLSDDIDSNRTYDPWKFSLSFPVRFRR